MCLSMSPGGENDCLLPKPSAVLEDFVSPLCICDWGLLVGHALASCASGGSNVFAGR